MPKLLHVRFVIDHSNKCFYNALKFKLSAAFFHDTVLGRGFANENKKSTISIGFSCAIYARQCFQFNWFVIITSKMSALQLVMIPYCPFYLTKNTPQLENIMLKMFVKIKWTFKIHWKIQKYLPWLISIWNTNVYAAVELRCYRVLEQERVWDRSVSVKECYRASFCIFAWENLVYLHSDTFWN